MEGKMANCTKSGCRGECSLHGHSGSCTGEGTALDKTGEVKNVFHDFSEILARSEKFKTLEDLIRGFGHELNNPLTAVIGYAKLLESIIESEEGKEFLSLIGEQTERCCRIINNFLGLVHRNKPAKEYTSVNDVIHGILSLKKAQLLKRAIVVEQHLEKDLPKIRMDIQQFQYVLLNIMMNAQERLEKNNESHRRLRISPWLSPMASNTRCCRSLSWIRTDPLPSSTPLSTRSYARAGVEAGSFSSCPG